MGIRVIKSAVAAVLAIYAAVWLELSAPLSAGLLAVLAVDVTRKATMRSALQRLVSSIAGLLLAALLFSLLGFHIWVIGLFIGAAYPLLARFRLKDGIVTSSVIMLHVFAYGSVTLTLLWNEAALLLTGLGAGAAINLLYMPQGDKQLAALRRRLEELYADIFRHIAAHLRNHDAIWSGQELLEAQDVLRQASSAAERLAGNQLFKDDHDWLSYCSMRRQQLDSIHRMAALVAQVYETLPHGEMVAELFDGLSRDVKSDYYQGNVLHKLEAVEQRFRQMELPGTRSEFEVRAAILQLALELKHYTAIARREKKKSPDA